MDRVLRSAVLCWLIEYTHCIHCTARYGQTEPTHSLTQDSNLELPAAKYLESFLRRTINIYCQGR